MSRADALSDLVADDLPPAVAALTPPDLEDLAAIARSAKKATGLEVSAATDQAVSGLPMPFRALVKKAIQ